MTAMRRPPGQPTVTPLARSSGRATRTRRWPAKVVDLELAARPTLIEDLSRYAGIYALVRLHGVPVGDFYVPVDEALTGSRLAAAAVNELADSVTRHLIADLLSAGPLPEALPTGALVSTAHRPAPPSALPATTVAVCTRERPDHLAACLESIERLEVADLEVIVVDNAPSTSATKDLVTRRFPQFHYVLEPRPGLDRARNRAIAEASGEVIAYTDDDVVVDPGWAGALAQVFADQPGVTAVTGLVAPYELETEAQVWFETYGGFGRGFRKRTFAVSADDCRFHAGPGGFGTGANMAFRREVFDRIGGFDPALDVGTPTNGGGDLEMFFRVLHEGGALAYEPGAIVFHKHRRDRDELATQLRDNGIGFFAYLTRTARVYPDARSALVFIALWQWRWHLRRLVRSLVLPDSFPLDLVAREVAGSLIGPLRYRRSRRLVSDTDGSRRVEEVEGGATSSVPSGRTAVRVVDVERPLTPIREVSGYDRVRIYAARGEHLYGYSEVLNLGLPVGERQVIDAVASAIVPPDRRQPRAFLRTRPRPRPRLGWNERPEPAEQEAQGHAVAGASIVIATRDRPAELAGCLRSLAEQETDVEVEVVVVDNGRAHESVRDVADASACATKVLVEARPGLSVARNTGIRAAGGEVIVTTDDDVRVPPHWLDRLVAPFSREEVMAVTGNVLPLELETRAQRLFEAYGGLGKGFHRREYGPAWFRQRGFGPRTWRIGATANAAFRSDVFDHPRVGLFAESLGAGRPAGVGEDTYLFYRILKAGGTIVYDPDAYVWHRHRQDLEALERQLRAYSAGHVAYHLTTLLQEGDLRSLAYLLVRLPAGHAYRLLQQVRGSSNYSLRLLMAEMAGSLSGPAAYLRSRRVVVDAQT